MFAPTPRALISFHLKLYSPRGFHRADARRIKWHKKSQRAKTRAFVLALEQKKHAIPIIQNFNFKKMIFATPNPKSKIIFLKGLKLQRLQSHLRATAKMSRGAAALKQATLRQHSIKAGVDFPKRPCASPIFWANR